MKLQGAAIERFLARPDPAVRAVVIFGADEGLVRERAAQLGRSRRCRPDDPSESRFLTPMQWGGSVPIGRRGVLHVADGDGG